MINLPQITHLEIRDEYGIAFARTELEGVSLESDGETLRITLDFEGEDRCNTATVLSAALYLLTCEEPNAELAVGTLRDHLNDLIGENSEK